MAYKASQSRRNFDSQLTDYCNVLMLVNGTAIDPTLRQYVVSAAVFLGHASFENYSRDLFSSLAKAFCAPGVTTEMLPRELRMFLLTTSANWATHFANFNANGDERRLLQNLANLFANPRKALAFDGQSVPTITGSEMQANRSYPSEDNLERVFERIGIPNVFDRLNAILKADSRLLLKGFADKRTELAHNAVMPGTSAGDIEKELLRFARFVAAVDRVSYAHVVKLVGQKIWYSAVC